MTTQFSTHLFLLGKDYHLGDLLWFTAVLAEYRRQVQPDHVLVGCPDRPISRILEHNPLIDEILYGRGSSIRRAAQDRFGKKLVLHDLRILPIAATMIRRWRHRLPWLYYRDLWLQERGQWLATFLGLSSLHQFRPVLRLVEEDRAAARTLSSGYPAAGLGAPAAGLGGPGGALWACLGDPAVGSSTPPAGVSPPGIVVLAPHTGQYTLPVMGAFWSKVKGWPPGHWVTLAHQLRTEGYEPVTLAAPGQTPVPGTRGVIGLPIRQVAGVIERATGLITVESGLWFIAAALRTPFIIVPWWLPRSINWAAPMQVPHRLIYRDGNSVDEVLAQFRRLDVHETA
jgi:hypothetical protein